MTPGELRELLVERHGERCQWPTCPSLLSSINPLELAHLTHRGMGGSKHANTPDNAALLCRKHHDILDGRSVAQRRYEVRELLRHDLAVTEQLRAYLLDVNTEPAEFRAYLP